MGRHQEPVGLTPPHLDPHPHGGRAELRATGPSVQVLGGLGQAPRVQGGAGALLGDTGVSRPCTAYSLGVGLLQQCSPELAARL